MNLPNIDFEAALGWCLATTLCVGGSLALSKAPGCVEVMEIEKTKRILVQICIEHPPAPGCKENNNDR